MPALTDTSIRHALKPVEMNQKQENLADGEGRGTGRLILVLKPMPIRLIRARSPPAASAEDRPRPLHVPPAWTVARGGTAAGTPTGRVENANAAARVEPRRQGYYNAIQIYPWSEGALYQVYAAPGQITNIALEPGESLTCAGPIAAGDTTRWIIGDTESGSGANRRVHIRRDLAAIDQHDIGLRGWFRPRSPP